MFDKKSKDQKTSRYLKCSKILIVLNTVLLISGIGVYFVGSYLLSYNIYHNEFIKSESPAFKIWKKPTDRSSVLRKYYLFDVQNPDEIASGKDKKPKLVERGPYVYNEILEKRDIEFLDENSVRYSPVSTLYFNKNLSNGTLEDKITFFNVPAWGMIEGLFKGSDGGIKADAINLLLKTMRVNLFQTKTVKELMNGYTDPLLTAAKVLGYVDSDKFSLLNGKNGTNWTHYTMDTGISDIQKIGLLKSWNNKKKLNIWGSEKADKLEGTDGTIFPPYLTRDKKLFAFNPDMCRTYSLVYKKDTLYKDVNTYVFHLPTNAFSNSTINPDNEGYCPGNTCFANGIQNISLCYGGVSSFISKPHFLDADPKLINSIDGLNPDHEKHDLKLFFHPSTGVALNGNIRFMISFYYQPNKHIDIIKHVQPTVIPMLWFEEEIKLDDDVVSQLGTVAQLVSLCNYSPIAMISFGGVGLLFSITLFTTLLIINRKQENRKEAIEKIKDDNESINQIIYQVKMDDPVKQM